ncbi:MAG: hypothetical protein ABI831_26000 [Betaproteobacteria bacterium]
METDTPRKRRLMREALGTDDEQWFSAGRTYRAIGLVALVIAIFAISATRLPEHAAEFVHTRTNAATAATSADAEPEKTDPAGQASNQRSGGRGGLKF